MAAAFPELTEVDERLNDLDRDCLSCTVCQELFQKAKVLPCNHSFCEQCLTKLVEKESKLDCPICNTSCQLPSGGVPRLKADFFINSLVELYSTKHSLDGEAHQVLCNGCEENEAATWCVDCSLYFCKSCIKPHNVIKRDHMVKTLQERRESKPSMLLQQKVYCSLHPENVVKYFCEICKVVVCTDCAITNHRSAEHILKNLKEAACEYKSQLEDLLSKVNARKQSPENLTTKANQARETLMSKCKVEEEKVKEKTAKVIEEIRREEKQLIEELREEYEGRAKEVEGQIDKVKLKHRDISGQCGYIEILMHLGTPAQLLNTTEETTNHLKRLISMDAEPHVEVEIIEFQPAEETNEIILGLLMSKKAFSQFPSNQKNDEAPANDKASNTPLPVDTSSLHNVDLSDCPKTNAKTAEGTGDTKPTISPREMPPKLTNGHQAIPSQQRGSTDQIHSPEGAATKKNLSKTKAKSKKATEMAAKVDVVKGVRGKYHKEETTLSKTGSVKTIGTEGQFCSPNGITINKHGDFVTADTANNRVQITDRDGNMKSTFTFPEFPEPFYPLDVAISAKDEYIMTDGKNKQVVVSDENGSLIKCFGEEIKKPGRIAISPVDGSVYISDWEWSVEDADQKGHCIKKYTPDFQYVKSFGDFIPKPESDSKAPHYLAVDINGDVFVADFNQSCIQVYDSDGELRHSFGSYGLKQDGKFNGPKGMAFDEEGYLYVSDEGNSSVQKFDKNGNFICRIDKPDDKLNLPQGLAITDDMEVVVCNWNYDCLKVFTQLT